MEHYRGLLRTLEGLREERAVTIRAYQDEYMTDLAREWKREKGRREFPPSKWADVESLQNFRAIHAMYQGSAATWAEEWRGRKDAINAELDRLAPFTQPEILADGEELTMVHRGYSGAYRSQGFGAMKYARESAQAVADKATYYGLRAEVRLVGEKSDCGYGITLQDFGVFANVTRDGWDVIQRRLGVPLRDWLKACWGRGVNPRVYNPWLPIGLEEKMGLDYFGHDVGKGCY